MGWNVYKEAILNKWKAYWFEIHPPTIAEYTWNYLFTGGKQIRPNLFCELWEYLAPDSKVNAELAFAIECIHMASIVLDDTPWMDNAPQRRGKPTLHIAFSPKKSLLIFYELMDIARKIWIDNKPSHIILEVWQNLLVTKLQRLAIGQIYDLEKKGNLIELASLKTGVLFELVTESVALCLDLQTEFWKVWGNNLGILFQWVDDWSDRDEDLAQGTRNAFNESYDMTLKNYEYLWSKLEIGIGKQWFVRPFGSYLKIYFTKDLPISFHNINTISSLNDINIYYINDINIPEINENNNGERYNFIEITGRGMLHIIIKKSKDFFRIPSLNINLWNIDESEWEQLLRQKILTLIL